MLSNLRIYSHQSLRKGKMHLSSYGLHAFSDIQSMKSVGEGDLSGAADTVYC